MKFVTQFFSLGANLSCALVGFSTVFAVPSASLSAEVSQYSQQIHSNPSLSKNETDSFVSQSQFSPEFAHWLISFQLSSIFGTSPADQKRLAKSGSKFAHGVPLDPIKVTFKRGDQSKLAPYFDFLGSISIDSLEHESLSSISFPMPGTIVGLAYDLNEDIAFYAEHKAHISLSGANDSSISELKYIEKTFVQSLDLGVKLSF